MIRNAKEKYITGFFRLESAGGILLILAALLALVFANTPFKSYYALLIEMPVEIRVGALKIAKPLLLWINDGLMAVFFFMVGLELKRELVEGELSDKKNVILPGVCAAGGMLFPALIYVYFNVNDAAAMKGWAIPAATDIAFALGVLTLLGSKVPTSLKVFLTSIAIFDDLGAILVIAFFYTANISLTALLVAGACIPVLFLFNRSGIESRSIYMLVGVIMWVGMLKSGVHATLTGVIAAAFIPLKSKTRPDHSPLKTLEHDLHSVVAFFVLPVFAFANAGLSVVEIRTEHFLHSVPLGIALGLFFGKQIGVFGMAWLFIKLRLARMPSGMNWRSLYGTAALCGIGFTMSLFIGSLAFEETNADFFFDERLGIILGSLLSAILGYLILRASLKSQN